MTWLSSKMYGLVMKAMFKYLNDNNETRSKTIHVTDLVYPCLRRTYYLKMSQGEEMNTETGGIFFMGHVVHESLNLAAVAEEGWHELWLGYDVERDKAMTKDEVAQVISNEPSRRYDILAGQIDELIKIKDTWVIVDKKTGVWGKKIDKPHEQYVEQLNMYRFLAYKCKGIDAKTGLLVYIDLNERLRDVQIFEIELRNVYETFAMIKDKMMKLKEALEKGEEPEPTYTWMCKGYCQFAKRCFGG